MTTPFDRRNFLRLTLLTAAQTSLTGCAQSPPPPGPASTGAGIDAHCHIFNARDLPIPGFVVHVVLESDPAADVQFGPLVTFIALLLDSASAGADQEVLALSGKSTATPRLSFADHARAAATAMQSTDPGASAARVITGMHNILTRPSHAGRVAAENPTGAASGADGTAPGAVTRRLHFLHALAGLQPGEAIPGAAGNTALPQTAPPLAPATAAEIATLSGTIAEHVDAHAKGANPSGIFYFVSQLTGRRDEALERLVALPQPADRAVLGLYTPAMIDFSFWLDDRASIEGCADATSAPPDVTPLSEQIAVMRAIAGATKNTDGAPRSYAMHPFVSFCPWRQIAEQQAQIPIPAQQFTLVREAVQSGGFIGVKLYPLMGFRPINNKQADPGAYPSRLRCLPNFATGLDAALEALYQWCVDNDVPLMAHCSFSQFPSLAGGRLGDPEAWMEVLSKYPTLRLNLAHAGGVWNLAASAVAHINAETASLPPSNGIAHWPNQVIAALGNPDTPHFYADIADYNDVIACAATLAPTSPPPAGGDASSITALARLVAANPAARARLMYGTDYSFLTQYAGTETYLAQMRGCLAPLLGIKPGDLLGGNAARFLGLTNPASKTRRRLDSFRGDKFLDRWNA
jgi:predicted TIM-barrel fold metal-dependent hydrolase